MYLNRRLFEPFPEEYSALPSASPVSSAMAGTPPVVLTTTISEKATSTRIARPSVYAISDEFCEETDATMGGVSIRTDPERPEDGSIHPTWAESGPVVVLSALACRARVCG